MWHSRPCCGVRELCAVRTILHQRQRPSRDLYASRGLRVRALWGGLTARKQPPHRGHVPRVRRIYAEQDVLRLVLTAVASQRSTEVVLRRSMVRPPLVANTKEVSVSPIRKTRRMPAFAASQHLLHHVLATKAKSASVTIMLKRFGFSCLFLVLGSALAGGNPVSLTAPDGPTSRPLTASEVTDLLVGVERMEALMECYWVKIEVQTWSSIDEPNIDDPAVRESARRRTTYVTEARSGPTFFYDRVTFEDGVRVTDEVGWSRKGSHWSANRLSGIGFMHPDGASLPRPGYFDTPLLPYGRGYQYRRSDLIRRSVRRGVANNYLNASSGRIVVDVGFPKPFVEYLDLACPLMISQSMYVTRDDEQRLLGSIQVTRFESAGNGGTVIPKEWSVQEHYSIPASGGDAKESRRSSTYSIFRVLEYSSDRSVAEAAIEKASISSGFTMLDSLTGKTMMAGEVRR